MPRPVPDLQGNRYGKLIVIRRAPDKISPCGNKRSMWECQCDCGNKKIVSGTNLRRKKTASCGCDDKKKRNEKGQFEKGNGIKDITGQKFGKLTVVCFDKIINKKSYWIVECECGTKKSVRSDTLKVITSCGCDKKKQDLINFGVTNHHELTYHPVYAIWNAMINRCENPKNRAYKNYGGRGIKACPEWHDIKIFAEWAEQNGFEKGKNLSIERIDVNGNYCPENCKWIDRKLQTRNRRNTVKLTINGEEKPLSEWTELFNVSYKKVTGRYYRGIRNAEDLFYRGNLQMRNSGRE